MDNRNGSFKHDVARSMTGHTVKLEEKDMLIFRRIGVWYLISRRRLKQENLLIEVTQLDD